MVQVVALAVVLVAVLVTAVIKTLGHLETVIGMALERWTGSPLAAYALVAVIGLIVAGAAFIALRSILHVPARRWGEARAATSRREDAGAASAHARSAGAHDERRDAGERDDDEPGDEPDAGPGAGPVYGPVARGLRLVAEGLELYKAIRDRARAKREEEEAEQRERRRRAEAAYRASQARSGGSHAANGTASSAHAANEGTRFADM